MLGDDVGSDGLFDIVDVGLYARDGDVDGERDGAGDSDGDGVGVGEWQGGKVPACMLHFTTSVGTSAMQCRKPPKPPESKCTNGLCTTPVFFQSGSNRFMTNPSPTKVSDTTKKEAISGGRHPL